MINENEIKTHLGFRKVECCSNCEHLGGEWFEGDYDLSCVANPAFNFTIKDPIRNVCNNYKQKI